MLKDASRSPNDQPGLYFAPDRGVSDPRISMPQSKLYGGLQEGLGAGSGYSSAAGGWSEDVVVESWSLPPVETLRKQVQRHRLVVAIGPAPTFIKWDDDEGAGEVMHASGAVTLMPLGLTTVTTWTSNHNVVSLEFSSALLSRLLDGRDSGAPPEQLIPRRNAADSVATALAHRMAAEMAAPTERLYGEMLCLAFAVHALQAYGRARVEVARGRLTPHQARRVLDYMHAYLGDRISVAALAREVGLSEAHFARLFKATFGEPPHRLILRWRLQRAARLIRLEGFGLADAAVATGFYDQPHMTRAAQRHFGASPASWVKL
jgi:AraC family transcriptional regulator